MAAAPSDSLRELYEQRALLQYAVPAARRDPRLDRKFQRTLELVQEHLPCNAFLDAGCGDGRFLAALPYLGPVPGRVVGVDISEHILRTARAAAARAGIAAELVRGNLEALPLDDRSFDLVLCSQTIEHLLDPDAGLRELARVVRDDGRVVLTTLNRRMLVSRGLNLPRTAVIGAFRLQGRRIPVAFPELLFDRDELSARCTAAGLRVLRTETFRFHLRPPLDVRPAVRALNALDRHLPRHGVGDILVVVATRHANE